MTDKKLNIGIFSQDFYPFIGGQGRYLYEFYKQNEKYQKINLYIFSPAKNNLRNSIQIFPETYKSKLRNVYYSYRLNKELNNYIKKYQLDIAHFQGGPGGIFIFRKLSISVIYTAHHTYWQQYNYIKSQIWKYIL